MAATKTSASAVAETEPAVSGHEFGSTAIQPAGVRGTAAPAGTLHLVRGWEPLCGADRVRFVFPGRAPVADQTCPECVQASLPRPRAPRSRARAS